MCILFVYTLLNIVNYYDLSVLSMSVICFPKKVWMGWVGGVSSIQVYFGLLEFFYLFSDVAALADLPYISRSSAVRPTLQTLAPIQSSTS